MVNIQKELISINYSKGVVIKPDYIVIHETDNPSDGADAKANRDYFANHPEAQASAHFVVDDNKIVQCLELNQRGWHVGVVYGSPNVPQANNSNTVGIEICVNADGDYNKAVNNAIDLTKYLMSQLNIPVERVIRHYDVCVKTCPKTMINNPSIWTNFKSALNKNYNSNISTNIEYQQEKSPIQKAKEFVGGRCKELQEKLIALGYNCGGYGADGDFGQGTYNSLIQFQKDNGLAIDGLAGNNTFNKLDNLISVKNQSKSESYDFRSLQKLIGAVQDNIAGSETLGKCPLIKYGSNGEVVRWVQNRLNYLGFNCGTADGIFGNMTKQAVIFFQQAKGLSNDSIVGNNTWSKLLGL